MRPNITAGLPFSCEEFGFDLLMNKFFYFSIMYNEHDKVISDVYAMSILLNFYRYVIFKRMCKNLFVMKYIFC